jgi:flagellar biosynthetic protein FlhB
MAEQDDSTDESQKTEEPTARRLEDARKRGQVPYSREINTWVVLFAAAVMIIMAGPGIGADLSNTLKAFLAAPHAMAVEGPGLSKTLHGLFLSVGKDLIAPFLILSLAGVISGFVQTGPIFSLDPITPDLDKVSILKGAQRLFSRKAVVELLKGIVKLVIVSLAATYALLPYFGGIEHFVGLDAAQSMFDLQALFLKLMTAILAVLFVVAALDYLYQRESFLKQMRMSKQELKDEYRQTEGDPHVKGKLKQLREKKARTRMMQAVPEADVVITNPTHYAVALKYDSKGMDAPVMVAKGLDLIAQKIKEIAKESKVPVVENPALARTLYDSMEIDQMIPREHWKAVAEVISYVFKLKGKQV